MPLRIISFRASYPWGPEEHINDMWRAVGRHDTTWVSIRVFIVVLCCKLLRERGGAIVKIYNMGI